MLFVRFFKDADADIDDDTGARPCRSGDLGCLGSLGAFECFGFPTPDVAMRVEASAS